MKVRIPYKFSKHVKRITIICTILIVGAIAALFFFSHSSFYIPTWFFLITICLVALYILSIPRFIDITDNKINIHCILELTTIKIVNITNIRKMDKQYIRRSFPLLGSFGFGGYFGYYFNPKTWNIFKIYASEWDNFVIITDIYEDMYVVNLADSIADELIDMVNRKLS